MNKIKRNTLVNIFFLIIMTILLICVIGIYTATHDEKLHWALFTSGFMSFAMICGIAILTKNILEEKGLLNKEG